MMLEPEQFKEWMSRLAEAHLESFPYFQYRLSCYITALSSIVLKRNLGRAIKFLDSNVTIRITRRDILILKHNDQSL